MKLPAIFVQQDSGTIDGYYGVQIWDEDTILSCHMLWVYRENKPLKERKHVFDYMNIRKMLIELEV